MGFSLTCSVLMALRRHSTTRTAANVVSIDERSLCEVGTDAQRQLRNTRHQLQDSLPR